MLAFLQRMFHNDAAEHQQIHEGLYADQYPEDDSGGARAQIRKDYRQRWPTPSPDPGTHPWLFDPCEPPKSWRYDPYYEMWIKQEIGQ